MFSEETGWNVAASERPCRAGGSHPAACTSSVLTPGNSSCVLPGCSVLSPGAEFFSTRFLSVLFSLLLSSFLLTPLSRWLCSRMISPAVPCSQTARLPLLLTRFFSAPPGVDRAVFLKRVTQFRPKLCSLPLSSPHKTGPESQRECPWGAVTSFSGVTFKMCCSGPESTAAGGGGGGGLSWRRAHAVACVCVSAHAGSDPKLRDSAGI